MNVGELVGKGRTSDVFAYGNDAVVKVAHREVPTDWPAFEAELTQAVHALGVPAPEVFDVVVVDGRPSVVFERIAGPSMWQQMVEAPDLAPGMARDLAAIHKELLAVGIPAGLPEFVDRLVRKIHLASELTSDERAEAIDLTQQLPRGAALLHGDLHPGNVLMGANGPVVIDWFDAAIGHPVADVIRSSILMQPGRVAAPRHLPDAASDELRSVRHAYLAEFQSELDVARGELARWHAVVAAGRLAEGAEQDHTGLLAIWATRNDDSFVLVDTQQ